MIKKFFSIALLLTMCAVAQAADTAAPVVVPAAPAVVAVPASTPANTSTAATAAVATAATKAVDAKQCTGSYLCSWVTPLWNATYVNHPWITLSAAGVATVAALYNYSETFRSLIGQGSADCEKCPCSKPPRQ